MKLNLIVAACDNLGIGIKGGLPWTLRKELKHFARMTKKVEDPAKKNVVIMGRNTWNEVKRALPGRINIVLTKTIPKSEFPESVIVLESLPEALKKIQEPELAETVENVWIIGGYSVYKEAMESEYCHRIYFTKVMGPFECDTFFPEISEENFKQVENDNEIPSEVQEEDGVKYQYQIFEKIR